MALRLNLFYDILCPRSWVFYQTLQKKLPYWRTFREIEVDYLPISANFLHEKIYGNLHPAGILARKKDHTAHFFRVGRELGVPFTEMDDIVMRIEERANKEDFGMRHMQLLFDDRIVAVPWFRIDSVPGHQKLFAFTEILRLEMLDEMIAQPCYNPLNHNVDNPLYFPPDYENSEEREEGAENENIAKIERRWIKRKKRMAITH
ncbi:hypothetical protein niasHT_015452 [Heterodera trifolii]|uniref:DSBA-like thioredoxin domain-containing protein n=1 Tax=Heterodera trifolii TaxID=157864 RepID=A0ABD2KZY5_9BILA